MRAAVIDQSDSAKHLDIREMPIPRIGPDEVLVRVTRAGICGSDTHGFLDADGTSRRAGLIMSHEIGGVIAEVGARVSGLQPGQRVHVDPQAVCRECPPCRRGWISICDHKGVLGSSLRQFLQGGCAEFIGVDRRLVHPIPDSVSDDHAPLLEPLANALHVLRRMELEASQSVLVIGAGPLGLCIIESLRAQGQRLVMASETSPTKRAIAEGLGAVTIDPGTDDVAERVRDLCGPAGVDVTIEAVGVTATYRQAIEVTRKRGRVAFFGAVAAEVTLPLLPILHKELTLIGCTGANAEDIEAAIEAVATGSVRFQGWPFTVVSLDGAEQAIRALTEPTGGQVKVLVDPQRTDTMAGPA